MTTLTTQFRKLALGTGAALVVWGTFLPWGCYHGWIYFCSRGLEFNVAVLRNISSAQIAFMALTAAAVYYPLGASQILKTLWQRAIVAVVAGAFFLVLVTGLVTNGGGLEFVLGAIAIIWATFRVDRRSALIAICVASLLSIFAAYMLVEPFTPRLAEMGPALDPEWEGRLLVFFGSFLMLGVSLFASRQLTQHTTQPPVHASNSI